MATQPQMDELTAQLERIRDDLLDGTLIEREAWEVLDRTAALLDKSNGGPFEENLRMVYSLVSAVWDTLRQQERLRDALSGD